MRPSYLLEESSEDSSVVSKVLLCFISFLFVILLASLSLLTVMGPDTQRPVRAARVGEVPVYHDGANPKLY